MIQNLAIIAAWVGEKQLACDQLALTLQIPGTTSYGRLKLLPWGWKIGVGSKLLTFGEDESEVLSAARFVSEKMSMLA
jgi:hypothetical protein